VYHIVALGCEKDPEIEKEPRLPAETIVEKILAVGGTPVLAHPAWSLNQPETAFDLSAITLTEIHNSVSDAGESSRPYSGCFADLVACLGKPMLLLATDDTHYYKGDDETKNAVMVECAENATEKEILAASDILIPGIHNVEDFMAAFAAVWGTVSVENMVNIIMNTATAMIIHVNTLDAMLKIFFVFV